MNSLKETDPEAREMMAKFKNPTELNVAFVDAGKYLMITGKINYNLIFADNSVPIKCESENEEKKLFYSRLDFTIWQTL